ncbi:hypothetical protein D3C78_1327010 [compost metagenome]
MIGDAVGIGRAEADQQRPLGRRGQPFAAVRGAEGAARSRRQAVGQATGPAREVARLGEEVRHLAQRSVDADGEDARRMDHAEVRHAGGVAQDGICCMMWAPRG